jgi:tissue inhibitor of metalloproteinase
VHRRAASFRRAVLAVGAALVGGVLAAAAGAGAERASACSCASTDDTAAFARADVVFQATLVDIVTAAGDSWRSTDPERFVFTVDKVFKGDAEARQSVVSARDGASCGLEIGVGGEYLLFGRYGDDMIGAAGELTSNLCSGTRPISAEAAVPATFGAGVRPAPGESDAGVGGDDQGLPVGWIVFLAAGAIVTVGTLVVVRRR